MTIVKPDWANYLENVGRTMAEVGPRQYGGQAPGALLSLPTGRFSYWMLVLGALQAALPPLPPVERGSRVATWLSGDVRMGDVVPEHLPDGLLKIGSTKVIADSWPMLQVPRLTPEDRGGRQARQRNARLGSRRGEVPALYVAMTRGRHHLDLSWHDGPTKWLVTPPQPHAKRP